MAGTASAQTPVLRFTGSTAYRSYVISAITASLEAGYAVAYTGTNASSASYAIYTGTLNSTAGTEAGQPIIIKTSWNGSVGGMNSVLNGVAIPYFPNGTTGSNLATPTNTEVPDAVMSDVYEASIPTLSGSFASDNQVGIVAFEWVANNGAPSTLNNISTHLAKYLFSYSEGNGTAPLALFTGLNSDEGTWVFATGRDPDSGTRLTAEVETGMNYETRLGQYELSASNGVITSEQLFPVATNDGISSQWVGNGGYTSGGTLATALTGSSTASTGFFVGYLSTSDAATALAGGAHALTHEGFAYSPEAIEEGQYTFWSYEHMMLDSNVTGNSVLAAAVSSMQSSIESNPSIIQLSQMNVSRQVVSGDQDGQDPEPNY